MKIYNKVKICIYNDISDVKEDYLTDYKENKINPFSMFKYECKL